MKDWKCNCGKDNSHMLVKCLYCGAASKEYVNPDLVIGQYYRVKKEVKVKPSENKLRFEGVERYREETKYNFWDKRTSLLHWINPENVEPI